MLTSEGKNKMDNQGMSDTMGPGADPATASPDQSAGVPQQALITAIGDGSFTIQSVADGQPVGEPLPVASIEEAMQGITDLLGGGASEAPPTEGELPPMEGAKSEPAPEVSEASPEEQTAEMEKAEYKDRQGTRPKSKPNWKDYTSGGNPLAK
jgi:hypothetical protein